MRMRLLAAALTAVLLTAAFAPARGRSTRTATRSLCGPRCGSERWAIKTLSDADHGRVDLQPRDETVDWLIARQRPAHPPASRRVAPIETETFRVRARLLGFKVETDRDYHLVLADLNDSSRTMVAEIPNPDCAGACSSGQSADFAKLRQALAQRFGNPRKQFHRLRPPPIVTVTGVGFFDFLHHQTGVAPNGIELHPVLGIVFSSR